jgi:hypothetical protein
MNKRIFELAEQSRDLVQSKHYLSGDIYYPGPLVPGDINLEKFAKLIVKECMKLNHDHFSDEDPYTIDSLYRQHFGVEE